MASSVAGGPHIWAEVYVMLWKGVAVEGEEEEEGEEYVTVDDTFARVV